MNPEDVPPPALTFGRNYLIFTSDGLYFRSGETGELRKLTPEQVVDVTPWLKERQRLAHQLTNYFRDRSFEPGGDGTIDEH